MSLLDIPNDNDKRWPLFALWGPKPRRRHDTTLLQHIGWDQRLADINIVNGVQCCVYRHEAYII